MTLNSVGVMKPTIKRQGRVPRVEWSMKGINRSGETWTSYCEQTSEAISKVQWSLIPNNTERWEIFCRILNNAAASFYHNKTVKPNQELKDARSEVQRQLRRVTALRTCDYAADPSDVTVEVPPVLQPGALSDLKAARRRCLSLMHQTKLRELASQIEVMNAMTHVGERTQAAYKYLKCHKKIVTVRKQSPVTLRDWQRASYEVQGDFVKFIEETDYFPMMPVDWYPLLEIAVGRARPGTAPGLDLLSADLIKQNEPAVELLYKIMTSVFETNDVPTQWTTTVTHPIPKKTSPKTVDDYRRITLCSVGYKFYAMMLQNQLENFLPSLREYQSGFVRNRSCDDEIFVLRRLLEERWNHGLKTYIVALDFEKAFDTVNIHTIPEVLSKLKVPHYLINRVISACLREENCIKWNGHRTVAITKSLGVKQGCPISPLFFNLMLDSAVTMLQQGLRDTHGIQLFLGEAPDPLVLPMLLAYADDTTLIADNVQEIELIIAKFIPLLSIYGLRINVQKSGAILKDPTRRIPVVPELQILVTNATTNIQEPMRIPFVDTTRILGVGVSEDMHRKKSIRSRCLGAVRLTKSLLPTLKKLKAPIELLMSLYHTVIVPSMLYGIKSGSMTQANEKSLMNRELQILRDLVSIASPVPQNVSYYQLLDGKTINRKVTVQRLRYYGHVMRMKSESLLRKAKSYRINQKRRVGRPLFTFARSLERDKMKFPGVGDRSAWRTLFKDRVELPKITAELYKRQILEDEDPMEAALLIYPTRPII